MTDQETKTPVVPIVPNQYFERFSDKELCEFYQEVMQEHIPMDAKIRTEIKIMNDMIKEGTMINWSSGSGEIFVIGVWQHLFYEMAKRFASHYNRKNRYQQEGFVNDIFGIVSTMADALDDDTLEIIFIAFDSESEAVYDAFGKITKERLPALFAVPELEDLDY